MAMFAPGLRVVAALLLVAGAGGCDWLTTAVPESPSPGKVARTVSLTEPDSVLVNIKEAFRVGSVQAYMRGIMQTSGGATEEFLAIFDQADAQVLPTDAAGRELVNGGWHSVQERNALTSMMNSVASSEPDTGRAVVVKDQDLGDLAEGRVLLITYRVNIPLGSSPYIAGTARLTMKRNTAGEWQILIWEDHREQASNPRDSWGAMRFKNRS
ncbi:MAG: hypothetical protein HZB25_03705 [Candidatus Eisenbacteria bacterium]|nr:hypothetical protein [Candidatus Eisenbacteria bacterium]